MTYDCMTPEELAAWLEAAARVNNGGKKPCVDCPLSFHLAEVAAGRCWRPTFDYAEDPRRYNREWMRGYRARSGSVQ